MPRRHQRSNIACQTCRQRKVRCSLNITGVPCIGCAQDGAECVVDPKRQERLQRTRMARVQHPPTPSSASFPNSSRGDRTQEISPRASGPEPHMTPPGNALPSPRKDVSLPQDPVESEERYGLEIAAAALGQPQKTGQVPFYAGGGTGPTSALDVCVAEQSLSSHFLVPSSPSVHLAEEDKKYLQIKGVFTIPAVQTCDNLLRAYFRHVHPILPILEPDSILNCHHAGRLGEHNVLILWCIFFVASNFVPPHVYEQEGYGSRKEMKAAMYARANCMYNHGGEMDKIILLQAALLMAFWHSEADEHTQPWYWMGIAISLCQMLGLHRDPDSSKYNSSVSNRLRHLWRRLWWSCFSRDRWLSLTLGRPLRIDLNDCDTPMPSADDFLSDTTRMHETMASYLPDDLPHLARHWVKYVEISILLGEVITMNYQVGKPRPLLQDVEALESKIVQCTVPEQDNPNLSRVAIFSIYHLQLHYHALSGTFYRPFVSVIPDGLDPQCQVSWQHRMRLKADAAASHTNTVVEAIAQDDLLGFSGPMTPPLLVPAMQTNLLNCRSGDSLSKRLRLNKLTMCMLVMEELQKTYTVASIYRGIFAKAIQQLFPEYTEGTLLGHSAPAVNNTNATAIHAAGTAEDATEAEPGIDGLGYNNVAADDFIDLLMDEASIFNFWDTWNRE
ncbi:Zn(II)2Cys6 transcription factor [Aspergillus affinis]|uniref:Zn(II)2Cys6 transcription factor n=1 Tax=Aspergillus affinis TaxID=1070780 RepID=UPI0022FF33B3|nr:cytochrome P450 monooxygenase [Aspergillus affinis]KAI9037575.1 cytochrome P450 monooxygenase [Aspergillus affinis]